MKTEAQKQREEGKEMGGIIVLVDGDILHRLWCGIAEGADLMIAHVESVDGEHHLMGRVRIHRDDRIWGGADQKKCLHLTTGNPNGNKAEEIGEAFFQAILVSSGSMFGFTPDNIHAFRSKPQEHALDALERLLETEVPERLPGWGTSVVSGDPETVQRVTDAWEAE